MINNGEELKNSNSTAISEARNALRPATLYVVATPIGNLADITLRSMETLRRVDWIFCEDTRRTRKILSYYAIHARRALRSLPATVERRRARQVVELLAAGNTVAYVTDAGSPGVSDPGARLVAEVRSAGYAISPLPGASATTAIISVCGFSGRGFIWGGFLPTSRGRRRTSLQHLLVAGRSNRLNLLLFEAPHRLLALLEELAELAPGERILVGRELTKHFEEIVEDSASNLHRHFASRSSVRGEFSLIVSTGRK